MKYRICSLALGLLPLALAVGCDKKEDVPAPAEPAQTETATEGTEAPQTEGAEATPAESTTEAK